jgi:hypothetical protein
MSIQVLGVEGQNPSGHCLMASCIYDWSPPASSAVVDEQEPPAKRRTSIEEIKDPEMTQAIRIVNLSTQLA